MADGDARDGITRRDFLDGVAITAAGLAAAAASPNLTGAEAAVSRAAGRAPSSRRLLPADRHGHQGPARQRAREDLPDRRVADSGGASTAKPGPASRAARGRRRGEVRLRGRRRRRERARGGQVLPRPLRAGQARAGARSVARLRRALAPQRVPRAQRGRRRRRPDDPAQRRHGEPGQHRRVEPARGQQAGHPRLLRAAGAGHARRTAASIRTTSPPRARPASPRAMACARCCCSRPADWGADTLAQNRVNATEPSTVAGWTAFVNRLPYSAAAKARSCASRPARRTGSRPSTAR